MTTNNYQKELSIQKTQKFNQLLKELPYYTHDYLKDKERNCQINTVLAYAYDLKTFFNYLLESNPSIKCDEIKNIPIDILNSLEFRDINEYQDYLKYNKGINNHNNDSKGILRRMAALRGLYKYGYTHDIFEKDPTVGSSNPRKDKEHIITRLNNNEVSYLVRTAQNSVITNKRSQKFCEKSKYRDTAILSLFLNTGIRVSELIGINLNDINFNENSIKVYRKGGKEMMVYFNESTSNALYDYINIERPEINDTALFLSNRQKRIGIKTVENIVKKYSQEITNKHITPHKLRSTYGTSLYHATGDIKLVADVLGHSDINTTSQNYIDDSEEHRKKAGKIDLY